MRKFSKRAGINEFGWKLMKNKKSWTIVRPTFLLLIVSNK